MAQIALYIGYNAFEELWRLYRERGGVYIPAGRTSLMAVWPLWRYVDRDPNVAVEAYLDVVPEPVRLFFGYLDSLKGVGGPYADIVKELEEIMGGPVEVYDTGFFYRGRLITHAPPLVRAVAPIYLIVRELLRPGDLLAIEMPEEGLHPGLQVKMVDVLAKLPDVAIASHAEAVHWRLTHHMGYGKNVKAYLDGQEVDIIHQTPTYDEVFLELYDESVRLSYYHD